MKKELVSVIMSTYNEPDFFLKKSIESVLNQTYKEIEFIIVCDAPSNKDIIRILNEYRNKDKRIKLIINKANIGLVNSLNIALKESNGSYIARMDADDISEKERISKQLNYINANNLDMIGSGLICINEYEKEIQRMNRLPKKNNAINKRICINNCIAHPTWFVRRVVFEENNGYRNIPYAEDYDFTLRALKKGFKMGNINELLLKYRVRENSISNKHGLEQFLISKELVRQYKNGDINRDISQVLIDIKTVTGGITELESKKYYLASSNFMKAAAKIKVMNPLGIWNLLKALIYSKYYRKKILGYIRALCRG